MSWGRRVLTVAVAAIVAVARHRRARRCVPHIGSGGEADQPAQRIPYPFQITGIDCLPNVNASTLTDRFRDRMGPLLGFDNPKLVPLGGSRTLWLLTDPYVDLSRRERRSAASRPTTSTTR